MITVREEIKKLFKRKKLLEDYLFSSECDISYEKDKLINQIASINQKIDTLRAKKPDQKIEFTDMEFHSKISDVWIGEAEKSVENGNYR